MKQQLVLSTLVSALALFAQPIAKPVPQKPKLVVAIAIDQFRYDYLTRYRSEYTGGFNTLLTKGAVFTNARYEHYPTVTAVGHSTFLTGATPAMSGIVGNDWLDRETGKNVTSVTDTTVKMLGGGGDGGASPRRLLVSTVGDELKIATGGKSKVYSVSLKDRSAILPGGHMADGAFWFDNKTGNFISSTFYFPDLPAWAKEFNATHPADKYAGLKFGKVTMKEAGPGLYAQLAPTPFGNELIEAFAEKALRAEQLGKHATTDILAVSFSCNDYVGHSFGPDSDEAHQISLATDKLLTKFLKAIDAQVGLQNALIVVTADHGVAPVPEVNQERRMPGGRIPTGVVKKTIDAALSARYGAGNWVVSNGDAAVFLNLALIAEKKLDRAEVNRAAAEAARAIPHMFRVYTRDTFAAGLAHEDHVARRVGNGFYPARSGDIYVLLEPYYQFSSRTSGTTHGTTFSYDSHVPVIFLGPWVKPGRYNQAIAPNDIAPTLATLLDVETPSGSVGRALYEIFARQ